MAIAFGIRSAGGRFLFPPEIEARLDQVDHMVGHDELERYVGMDRDEFGN